MSGNVNPYGYARVSDDWYQEDRQCVDALLDVESFTGASLDPSCGAGNIPEAMKARGLHCLASDIADRGYEHAVPGVSFFDYGAGHGIKYNNIVSNPPYNMIEPYIDHALKMTCNKVAVIARLSFLEGQERQALWKRWPLARVWVSSRRLSMPPGGKGIKAKGGTVAYAWFVFEHGHTGPATIGWI